MAFSTPQQLLAQVDARTVGQLASDTNIAVSSDLLVTNPNVLQALSQASGRMQVAFNIGQMYSAADIQALITAGGSSADYLAYICNEIAFSILWNRRPTWGEAESRDKARENAERLLKELRTGEAIFDIAAATEAAVPSITGPSSQTIRNLNGVVDLYGRGRMLPRRRLPNNR